ncbi:JAG1 [Cordylochernes scorpioides]|uniref:Delta-like protein n=1 Tax=Cordylochernes scorpioides TaxID=51811 RepID=A0ABY6LAY5_9ARAC|nr:JAG1 [Cordylochernes scorpioides]
MRTFTLILEAVDLDNSTRPVREQVIESVVHSGLIHPNPEWHTLLHQGPAARIAYRIRVRCEQHHYGSTCTKYCRPRNDVFGHYECDDKGNKVCLPGWKDANCMTAVCKEGCHPVNGFCKRPDECQCRPGWKSELCDQCMPHPDCVHGYCNGAPWQCICDINWGGILCDQDLNFCGTHEPCKNGGTCEHVTLDEYVCTCPEGFSGKQCDIVENPCATGTCQHGECSDANGTYTCSCLPGWTGDRCHININDCSPTACANGGRCVDLVGSYRCECSPGWKGERCQQDVDECLETPQVCGPHSRACLNTAGGFQCVCQPGWSGERCEHNPDDCVRTRCQNGATCIDLVGDYHCACPPGFTGRQCQTNIDDCADFPCLNGGECVDHVGDFSCICPVGYRGPRCEVDDDPCNPNPCSNGASCVNLHQEYYCLCPRDFLGRNCSQPRCARFPCDAANPCDNNGPCGDHGKCISESTKTASCICKPGYSGPHCRERWRGATCNTGEEDRQFPLLNSSNQPVGCAEVNECDNHPCQNNGTCIDLLGNFTCQCAPGWQGPTCNTRVHLSCDATLCLNGGTCLAQGASFICQCASGWQGSNCQTPLLLPSPSCISNPCQNGGSCISKDVSFYYCQCAPGFTGSLCQFNKNDCDPNPCYNGGECIDGANWFRCQCKPGFSGPDCRININECASSPCSEGATCVDGIGSFQCLCPPHRTGLHCQEEVALGSGCLHRGKLWPVGSQWPEDCNLCSCHGGGVVACTQLWCGLPNCLPQVEPTEPITECTGRCGPSPEGEGGCLMPPCLPRGACQGNQSHVPDVGTCKPGVAEPGNNCARLTLSLDTALAPPGLTAEAVCMQLRRLPALVRALGTERAAVLLCGVGGPPGSLELSLWVEGAPDPTTYQFLSRFARTLADLTSRGPHSSPTLKAILEIRLETSLLQQPESAGFLLPLMVSLISAVILAGCVGLAVWYYRRRRRDKHLATVVPSSKLEDLGPSLAEVSNNQNEENYRRYRNPLLQDIPNHIFKPPSCPDAHKNFSAPCCPKEIPEKDNNLLANQRRLAAKEVIV